MPFHILLFEIPGIHSQKTAFTQIFYILITSFKDPYQQKGLFYEFFDFFL